MTPSPVAGMTSILSHQSVDHTIEKLERILEAKGAKLFALVDHSGEAEKAGLQMLPTKLLIFGDPKTGTPLMVASRSAALDLPLKALIWQDADGKVWISYNTPQYIQERHGFSAALRRNIEAIEPLLAKVAE